MKNSKRAKYFKRVYGSLMNILTFLFVILFNFYWYKTKLIKIYI